MGIFSPFIASTAHDPPIHKRTMQTHSRYPSLQLTKGLDEIRKDKSIALLGAMQALFEGAMYTCMRACSISPASASPYNASAGPIKSRG
jgi:hypothetical protein